MRTKFIGVLLSIIALAGCATKDAVQRHTIEYYLPGVHEALEEIAKAASDQEVNYFFVGPVSHRKDGDYSYAYWMTKNWLIILDLPVGKADVSPMDYSWYLSRGHIDLAKDVVPAPGDVNGSNILMPSTDIQKLLRECLQGTKVVIRTAKRANRVAGGD